MEIPCKQSDVLSCKVLACASWAIRDCAVVYGLCLVGKQHAFIHDDIGGWPHHVVRDFTMLERMAAR